MSNGRATNKEMDELHKLIAKTLAEKIRSGEATAADLNVARAFLKDNGVEAVAAPGSPIAGLTSVVTNLPFPSEGLNH